MVDPPVALSGLEPRRPRRRRVHAHERGLQRKHATQTQLLTHSHALPLIQSQTKQWNMAQDLTDNLLRDMM